MKNIIPRLLHDTLLQSLIFILGPSYPNSGIWKNIYIQGYSSAVMRDVMIFPKPSKEIPDDHDEWTVTARVYYDSAVENEEAKFEFYKPGGTKLSTTVQLEKGIGKSVDLTLTEGVSFLTCTAEAFTCRHYQKFSYKMSFLLLPDIRAFCFSMLYLKKTRIIYLHTALSRSVHWGLLISQIFYRIKLWHAHDN